MLGERIAMLRRQQGISQQALARAIAVSASAVGMYEQGRREPSLDRLVAIAQLFGVSADYLLTGVVHTAADVQAAQAYLQMLRGRLRLRQTEQEPSEQELRMFYHAILDA